MTAVGALFLIVLGVIIPAAGVVLWRRPALGLPVFAAGFALHNAVLMVLIDDGVPTIAVRLVQAWKEELLVLLALRLISQVVQRGGRSYLAGRLEAWRRSPLLVRVLDAIAISFGLLLIVYLLLPSGVLGPNGPGLAQRLVSFRTFALIPVLYSCGRIWPPLADINWRWVTVGVVGVSAGVAVLGLIELWFIHSRSWVDWGIIQFDSFLGFHYQGPGELPENFFQSTTGGLALRRMVSTYLSPLGVAYTALLVIPMAMAVALWPAKPRRPWAWLALGLIVLGLALSLTRLALVCGAVEAIVMAVLFRRRLAFAASGAIIVGMLMAVFVYPNYGPVVAFDLTDVRSPAGAQLIGVLVPASGAAGPSGAAAPSPTPRVGDLSQDIVSRAVSGQDASITGHIHALNAGAEFTLEHPLGVGLGGAVPRYGTATGPGESALFQVGEEIGLLGLLLFILLYGLLTLVGLLRSFFEPIDRPGAALSLIVGVGGLALSPIVLTSQVWGDFSVTFFFWWVAGAAVTAWSANPFRPFEKKVEPEVPTTRI